eukprot:scaffold135376_cov139-Phaeocystis_antarctica.AAC.1
MHRRSALRRAGALPRDGRGALLQLGAVPHLHARDAAMLVDGAAAARPAQPHGREVSRFSPPSGKTARPAARRRLEAAVPSVELSSTA